MANWLTLNTFFEIEGKCNNLCSLKVIPVSLGERKVEEPVLEILKPSPLPMKIWSGPSKWVNCLIFWESPITWKLAQEGRCFQGGVKWKVESGDKVRFWEVWWNVDGVPLKAKYPRLYLISDQQNRYIQQWGWAQTQDGIGDWNGGAYSLILK